jgi:2-keto-3-deoxy-6-phosphogluconate aldolase
MTRAEPPHTAELTLLRQRIREDGLIAAVTAPVPGLDILAVGDGLLASPILVMEISLALPDAPAVIGQLRQRFGRHMLIGAGDVGSTAGLASAGAAGAQFVMLSGLDGALVAAAHAAGILAIPPAQTSGDVRAAAAAGCRLVQVTGAAHVFTAWHQAWPGIDFIVSGDWVAQNGASWRDAGACAVRVNEELFGGPLLTQARLITRARQLRSRLAG